MDVGAPKFTLQRSMENIPCHPGSLLPSTSFSKVFASARWRKLGSMRKCTHVKQSTTINQRPLVGSSFLQVVDTKQSVILAPSDPWILRISCEEDGPWLKGFLLRGAGPQSQAGGAYLTSIDSANIHLSPTSTWSVPKELHGLCCGAALLSTPAVWIQTSKL